MSDVGQKPKRLMTRRQMHRFLVEEGFPFGWSTLTKLCTPSIGGGPPIAGFWPDGRGGNDRPLYDPDDALVWARGRLIPASGRAA
jgi:hypothetical protein